MTPSLLPLLYSALSEPIGLLLFTPQPERARQALYRARVQANDQALAALQFRLLGPTDLAICHEPEERR